MSTPSICLSNTQARRLWLHLQGMSDTPCVKRHSAAFAERVAQLGMVQLDAIGILSRAHHHILWSRQSAYRPSAYNHLIQRDRSVFEHFSHDAVILPMTTYPYWQRQQQRRSAAYLTGTLGREIADKRSQKAILDRITKQGPVCSRDLTNKDTKPADRSKHAWMRPAHKLALDYLWLSGTLSVSHRHNFTKYYDLTERVIPTEFREKWVSEQTQINWLCEAAITRLGFASAIEIQRFWEACSLNEVQIWLQNPSIALARFTYLDSCGKSIEAFAPESIETTIANLTPPSSRVRIVSPFDPIVRDRARLKRLFGYDYRIEIYTPKAKRIYGYYVYPMLEADRYIGRIDVRVNRDTDTLETRAWWLEPGVKATTSRTNKIQSELTRLAKLADAGWVGELPPLSFAKS